MTEEKKTKDEQVEIVFDFSKVDLFDFIDVLEMSARANADGEESSPADFVKFLRAVRSAYVSSSRPLTGEDFKLMCASFWQAFKNVKSPND